MEKHPPQGPIPVLDTPGTLLALIILEESFPDTFPGDEPCAQIWSVYISEAEKYDKALVDSWRGNMNGILIFAGLFSAILTAFIIESYKTLQLDPTLAAIYHISQQLANATATTPAPQDLPSHTAALVCNILWFFSLGLSLASAMTATLVEQWARDFLQHTEMLPSPVKRARIFSFLYYGLQRFEMHNVVTLIPFLLHMSLLLFFGGLLAFLLPVSVPVAIVAGVLLGCIVLLYGLMTLLPIVWLDCPYKTPLSNVLWSVLRWILLYTATHENSPHLHANMVDAMVEKATVRDAAGQREARDKRALAWTMKSLADDDELEPFVEGIPNAIWGPGGRRIKYDDLIRGLLEDPLVLLGSRIEHLMLSCESGLLEPNAQARRQISCLKAIWCLGMTAEKNDNPTQPLFFLQGSRFLPPSTPITEQYLPSISALTDWNTLCSLHGHVEKLAASLRIGEIIMNEGGLPSMAQYVRDLQEFLAQRRRCNWHYLIPITAAGLDLESLSTDRDAPWTLRASSDWIHQVSQVISTIPACWNGVQYRILLAYLQQAADLAKPPYEFELTCKTIQAGLAPVDNRVAGHVAVTFAHTFADNVRKAVRNQGAAINHVDAILGIMLPWFDTPGPRDSEENLDLVNVHHLTDSVVEYVNNRESDAAVCRVLQDCDLTRVWNRVAGRLATCRPDSLGEVSKAMWHLAALFPGVSSPDVRLSTWPHFNGDTLSVVPVAPYAASVVALVKSHILNAYEEAEILLHLQALDAQITANEQRALSAPLLAALRDIEDDWALMAAVCSLMVPLTLTTTGRPLQRLEAFPVYTVQTNQAYGDWRARALAAVHGAIELVPRLHRRMEEARLVITTEFIQACAAAEESESDLPYKALATFTESLAPILWVSHPPHPDNQRSFAAALRRLAESAQPLGGDPLRLLYTLINVPLFNDGLPWLDDREAILAMKSAWQFTVASFDFESPTQRRKLADILNWLELKEIALGLEGMQNDAGPSRVRPS
ncbi:hypothetical protein B0H15DRAFT_607678 [Mycena belliarum]|uniref:DUF6535 domain-containing protein n=1 Tax=Mycena belliarum TaxID=1033014 RepID=A0AAD6XK01_9AGAR|nr:hypothetical protein B0H15DRAFT_607678 [Mycena belliae]